MKYLNFDGLSHFLSKLRGVFSVVGHTHTKSEITDYVVDSAMSSTSTNPVQNKVVNTALSGKVSTSRKINGKALTADITLSASDVGADASGTASTKANEALESAKTYADEKVADLVDSAPDTLNTLNELATAIQEHQDVTDALDAAITKKVDKVEGKGLSTNDYTDEDKAKLVALEADVEKKAEGVDWNENDSTSPAYVKNRTHGIYNDGTVILTETILPYVDDVGMYMVELPIDLNVTDGLEYTVVFNGVIYECVAIYDENEIYDSVLIGNPALAGKEESDGHEPFLVMTIPSEPRTIIGSNEPASISIIRYAESKTVFSGSVDVQVGSYNEIYGTFICDHEFVRGDTYVVVLNGHMYECKSIVNIGELGNMSGYNQDMPFGICMTGRENEYRLNVANTGVYSLKIIHGSVHKLDAQYLPQTADWDNDDPTSSGYIANRTHYKSDKVDLISLTQVYPTEADDSGNCMVALTGQNMIWSNWVGIQWSVGWDGKTYQTSGELQNVGGSGSGAVYVVAGNPSFISSSNTDTGEDFCVAIASAGSTPLVFWKDDGNPHTVCAYYSDGTEFIKQLDEEYIPDTIARTSQLQSLATEDYVTTLVGETPVSEQISTALVDCGMLTLDPNDTTISGEATPINADTLTGLTYDQVKTDIVSAATEAAPVQSVNGATGDVVVSTLITPNCDVSARNEVGYPGINITGCTASDESPSFKGAIRLSLGNVRNGYPVIEQVNPEGNSVALVYTTANPPSYAEVGAAAASHVHDAIATSTTALCVTPDTTNPYFVLSKQGIAQLAIQKISGNTNTAALHWYNETDGSWVGSGNIWSSANLGFNLSGTTLTITKY